MEYDEEKRILTINYEFNKKLKNLPLDVKEIIFSENISYNQRSRFNQPINKDDLPQNITHLTFGSQFNQSVDNLPKKLTHLIFGAYFNKPVDNLPENLTHLTFRCDFDQTVDKLPKNLTYLSFGDRFNQQINNLPKTLTYLSLGVYFEQSINNLPNTLTYLSLGGFNQPIGHQECDDVNCPRNLPINLTHLAFGYPFNQKIHNLPKKINTLKFWAHHGIKDNIPEQIEKIIIVFDLPNDDTQKIDNIPTNVKIIEINYPKKMRYIKKIPFGCNVIDSENNILLSG